MPTVVIAPDSFKGTLSAASAATAMASGWASVRPDDTLVLRPMADGGEGTVEAFASAHADARRIRSAVTGPDGRPVDAEWLMLGDGTAVIELASASGLHLLDPLSPLDAHTLGFGELIAAALDAGASRLVLAIGGSASTDGGAGMLTALGARLLDGSGALVALGNRGLAAVSSVDLAGLRTAPAGSIALSDVTNPLLGPTGAAAVFGPQKGATPAETLLMDSNLAHLVETLGQAPAASLPGSGSAGGTGFGLLVWGVPLRPGSETVGELVGLPSAIESADLVITGEGRFDSQTASGKVAHYVASVAGARDVPVALVAGAIEGGVGQFADSFSLSDAAGSIRRAMSEPSVWLYAAGVELARWNSFR